MDQMEQQDYLHGWHFLHSFEAPTNSNTWKDVKQVLNNRTASLDGKQRLSDDTKIWMYIHRTAGCKVVNGIYNLNITIKIVLHMNCRQQLYKANGKESETVHHLSS